MLSVMDYIVFSFEGRGRGPRQFGAAVDSVPFLAHAFPDLGVSKRHSRSDYKYSLSSFGIHDFY